MFMTQELCDLKTCIIEGRYDDALVIVDELEGMSKQDILRKIESFLVRLLIPGSTELAMLGLQSKQPKARFGKGLTF